MTTGYNYACVFGYCGGGGYRLQLCMCIWILRATDYSYTFVPLIVCLISNWKEMNWKKTCKMVSLQNKVKTTTTTIRI